MLRQVVIDDQCIATGVTEVLTDGCTGKGSIVAHRGRVGCCCCHHHGVVHGVVLLECIDQGCHSRGLLPDGHVDTVDWLASLVVLTLIDDGVDSNSGFANLSVTNDKLALSTTDGNHRVDGLETSLQRLVHWLTEDDTRSLALKRQADALAVDVAASVDGLGQDIDDTSQQSLTHLDRGNLARAAHLHVLADGVDLIEQNDTNVTLLKVHSNTCDPVLELHQFVGLNIAQAIDVCHTVAHLQHRTDFLERYIALNVAQLLFQYVGYFAWVNHLN